MSSTQNVVSDLPEVYEHFHLHGEQFCRGVCVCVLKFYCIFLLIEILYRGHGDITMGKSSKKLGSNLHAIPLTIDSL